MWGDMGNVRIKQEEGDCKDNAEQVGNVRIMWRENVNVRILYK